jgi:predicted CoA-binding protein
MDSKIKTFIENKKVAVVGASRQGNKFGNAAGKELQARGYEVFYIHPEAKEINGDPTYPNLDSVKEKADTAWVCVPPKSGEAVLRQAAEAGIKKVWLQMGADSPELIDLGAELNLDLVAGKCILMYAEPVRSFHKFHQVIWKMIGKY